ncbi:MAG TPA: LysR family transcriptional regulator [Vicinamibacterales bacterium]|nr:LysR family transcriptional regulator [Vicinamibacterales bacterium]
MKNLDVRVLAVLRELQRTANVSHAAQNLGLSQSAISMSLARLRHHFNDPMFVRTSRGMEPTPYAERLLVELNEALEKVESALGHRPSFDPATSDRMFHLVSTDLSQMTIIPPLAKRLGEIAPSVRINLKFLDADLPRLLESGEADLAVATIPQMGAGFCQQRCFASKFRCAAREGHPRVKGPFTLEQFETESHISVTTYGIGFESFERALQAKKIQRNIGMRLPSFFGISEIIAATNYLAVVPGWFSRILEEHPGIRIWPLPFSVPGYEVTLNWHERYTRDPGHQWLRATIQSLFEAQPPIAPPGVNTKGSALSRRR